MRPGFLSSNARNVTINPEQASNEPKLYSSNATTATGRESTAETRDSRDSASPSSAPPPPPPGPETIDTILRMLNDPSDTKRIAGLLLLSTTVPIHDVATLRRAAHSAGGLAFLDRLLLPVPADPHDDLADEHEILVVAVLSVYSHADPDLAQECQRFVPHVLRLLERWNQIPLPDDNTPTRSWNSETTTHRHHHVCLDAAEVLLRVIDHRTTETNLMHRIWKVAIRGLIQSITRRVGLEATLSMPTTLDLSLWSAYTALLAHLVPTVLESTGHGGDDFGDDNGQCVLPWRAEEYDAVSPLVAVIGCTGHWADALVSITRRSPPPSEATSLAPPLIQLQTNAVLTLTRILRVADERHRPEPGARLQHEDRYRHDLLSSSTTSNHHHGKKLSIPSWSLRETLAHAMAGRAQTDRCLWPYLSCVAACLRSIGTSAGPEVAAAWLKGGNRNMKPSPHSLAAAVGRALVVEIPLACNDALDPGQLVPIDDVEVVVARWGAARRGDGGGSGSTRGGDAASGSGSGSGSTRGGDAASGTRTTIPTTTRTTTALARFDSMMSDLMYLFESLTDVLTLLDGVDGEEEEEEADGNGDAFQRLLTIFDTLLTFLVRVLGPDKNDHEDFVDTCEKKGGQTSTNRPPTPRHTTTTSPPPVTSTKTSSISIGRLPTTSLLPVVRGVGRFLLDCPLASSETVAKLFARLATLVLEDPDTMRVGEPSSTSSSSSSSTVPMGLVFLVPYLEALYASGEHDKWNHLMSGGGGGGTLVLSHAVARIAKAMTKTKATGGDLSSPAYQDLGRQLHSLSIRGADEVGGQLKLLARLCALLVDVEGEGVEEVTVARREAIEALARLCGRDIPRNEEERERTLRNVTDIFRDVFGSS